MDILSNLAQGFGTALQPEHLIYIVIGEVVGVVIGILPGINASMAVATLLPITFGMAPLPALILLSGIYTGAMFGGSITSILLNVPGTSTAAVVALDGYRMTQQGRAGAALGITAYASWIAGTLALLILMTVGPALATVALSFGAPEYFALIVLGLMLITSLAGKSVVKGLIAGAIGLILGTVGIDPISGVARFNFGVLELLDGIDFIAVLVGLFAVSEVLVTLEGSLTNNPYKGRVTGLLPTRKDWKQSSGAIARGSVIGSLVGFLPGAGATVASFMSYTVEKRRARDPKRFGEGAIEGVAGPGGADNAAAGTALIPLLTLGIPGSETTAVMLGALMIVGVRPGPLLFENQPELIWGLIAALWIANLIGLILTTAGVRWLTQVLRTPTPIMASIILAMSFVGAYAVNNSMVDVWVMVLFGFLGYVMKKVDIPVAAIVLAMVLGPMAEESLRQGLLMGGGDFRFFLGRPITATLLALSVLALFSPWLFAKATLQAEVEDKEKTKGVDLTTE